MYDLIDKTWTDRQGVTKKLSNITDSHLLNIQHFIKDSFGRIGQYVEASERAAEYYNAYYSDRDWFSPECGEDEDEVRGNLKIALMKVSEEVNKRELMPL